jgi:hypothetical protein
VVNVVNPKTLDGIYGASDVGQTSVRITGVGFADELVGPIQFTNPVDTLSGTQYSYTVDNNNTVMTKTVQQTPGLVDVRVCTVTGCNLDPPADQLYLYPPGDPSVNSILPKKGPAAGGTKVTIGGDNVGCPLYVFFGNTKVKAVMAGNRGAESKGFPCGSSTTTVDATSPPGNSGSSVRVSVMTIESYFTGAGRGTTTAVFTYT